MANPVGQQFGRYRLLSSLGQGGFARVYLAEHIELKNKVAIKVLKAQLGEREIDQFRQEATIIASLSHPNIIGVLEFGVVQETSFLVMEYASKGSLRQRHPEGSRIPLSTVVSYVKQIANALQYAHDQKLIHRDIKPENLLLGQQEQVLLSDFGIAIISQSSRFERQDLVGTATYMAPEQALRYPSRTSDQYSLGIVVYEWLCGTPPFSGNTTELIAQHLHADPPPMREYTPTLSPAIEQVVRRALTKEPQKRFENILEFALALENVASLPTSIIEPPVASDRTQPASPKLSTALFPESVSSEDNLKDFFISYNRRDRSWAEWIAWQLDDAGYSIVLPPWGIRPDSNFEMEMQKASAKAKRTLVVLSPDYLNILSSHSMRLDRFQQDTKNEQGKFLSIMVRECSRKFRKLLESINYIDFTFEDEVTARIRLLEGIKGEYVKPMAAPAFPRNTNRHSLKEVPSFPNEPSPSPIYPPSTGTTLVQQIETAFAKRDWLDVIRKVDLFIKHFPIPGAISVKVYQMQGQALLEEGEIQRAREALDTALALASDIPQRLELLRDYTALLASLGQWNEVVGYTHEALRFVPNDSHWFISYQHALNQLDKIKYMSSQGQALPTFTSSIEIFFSYSHKDKKLRSELEKYLSHLKRLRSISGWYDGEIEAGKEWAQEINRHLSEAQIILLLVSQDFMASDYCYDIEMQRALERHQAGEACVIPIILRPALWENTPIGKLQALPTGAKPIATWKKRDEAYLDVARGIQKAIDKLVLSE